jgi:hypothetical protein
MGLGRGLVSLMEAVSKGWAEFFHLGTDFKTETLKL